MKERLITAGGWAGMVLVLLAFMLVSLHLVSGTGYIYEGMNFVGAIALGVQALHRKLWAFVTLNGTWTLVALGALIALVVR